MKLMVIGDEKRTRTYLPDLPVVDQVEVVVVPLGSSEDELLECAGDADFIMVDAIGHVSANLISHMPNLKLIHSEGVAFNAIDLDAARAAGITVCNNAGVNAGAVAEQAVMLMLGCLRHVIEGDRAVRTGKQIQMKDRMMSAGFRELSECTVGFVGFGAIAQATAERLIPWGCSMVYNKRTPLSGQDEQRLHVSYATLDDLIEQCDIVSLHVPVTDQTSGMVDEAFLDNMKPNGILINTARGEIVNQEALADALINQKIAAAGLDTLSPEPVTTDNPLVNLPKPACDHVLLSPHIGGVTGGMFARAHKTVWENIQRVIDGEQPINIVS